jgi:hypothetical protein
MKRIIILIISLTILLGSCYEPYNISVDSNQMVLVVNGMITNESTSYQILLNYAAPFNSGSTGIPVDNAVVSITDNQGINYPFSNTGNGLYLSNPSQFTGQPGNAYKLHIKTFDGFEYESGSQKLFPEAYPDKTYSEFDNKEILNKSNGSYVLSHGGDILVDIVNNSDTLPRYRFTSDLITQYFYSDCQPFQPCIFYYCWQTDNANPDINLTGGKYSISSASINKHYVCFVDDNLLYYGLTYTAGYQGEGLPYKAIPTQNYRAIDIINRILYLQQYTLNKETYEYYKKMSSQLQSEGKLFDPIAAQLSGNIKCITDPDIKVFGFFEASSVSRTAYKIDFRNLTDNQPSVTEIGLVLPSEPNGCEVDNKPLFWIN